MQQAQRSPIPSGFQQMSPLSLVTHGVQQNQHHRLMNGPQMGQMPTIAQDFEKNMIEYIKMLQNSKEAPPLRKSTV